MQNTDTKQRIHLRAPSGLLLKIVWKPTTVNLAKFLQQSLSGLSLIVLLSGSLEAASGCFLMLSFRPKATYRMAARIMQAAVRNSATNPCVFLSRTVSDV